MLNPSRVGDVKVTAGPGMRVVTPAMFKRLKQAVTAYALGTPVRGAGECPPGAGRRAGVEGRTVAAKRRR